MGLTTCAECGEDNGILDRKCAGCGRSPIPRYKSPPKPESPGASSRPEGASPEGPTPDPRTHSEGCWAWHPTCAQDRVRKALAYLEGIDCRIAGLTDAELEAVPEKARRILRGMP